MKYTPYGVSLLRRLVLCTLLAFTSHRGAIFGGALMSKLLYVLALDYLRLPTLRFGGAQVEKLFFSAKKKNTERSNEHSVFLAEKKGFEPSRRLPDLHP